ncbi:hypothetical protein C8A05DRAFT_41874 [Staphylotrichum tortipilum]|uniref:F-box domain-containing protein n=1 Tax=Staphylotrichum tortipilum TaxID=2831512 RepID=A0AAN6MSG7_9PEZI|nr:hypothetical protein C8A05DRAFT_41874 [Staphylotrichum longicolle]
MASSPMQASQQQGQQTPQDHEMDTGGTGLHPVVAVQLIAKTTHLSISDCGGDLEEASGSGDRNSSPTRAPPAGTAYSHPPALPSDLSVQLYAATTEEWQGDASGAAPATASVLIPDSCLCCVWMAANPSRTREEAVDPCGGVADGGVPRRSPPRQLSDLPNELLLHILGYLEVCDLLATSRTSHHLRTLSLAPYTHHARLRRTRAALPPMLSSPSRPSRIDLIRRSIFLTPTTFASRRLAHSLASIRLSRHLAARPSAALLVERCVLPPECLPCEARGGGGAVAPALVARKRAVERERVKDGLRAWVGSVWRGEVGRREEGVRIWEERAGVGRVWRLRRFWERVGRGDLE